MRNHPKIAFVTCLIIFFTILRPESSVAGGNHALVIGIDQYTNISNLDNAVNDADSISAALSQADFRVTKVVDPSHGEFIDRINAFFDAIVQSDCTVFYFAGHGVQSQGQNFLIPRDFAGNEEMDLWSSAVPLDRVISSLANSGQKVSIVIVDACRNNPFASTRNASFGSRGLAPVTPPIGSLIAYSADAGQVAIDGTGGQNNGLYTGILTRYMTRPGLRVEDIFNETRKNVFQASGGKQSPAEYSKLINTFYFRPNPNHQNLPAASIPPKSPGAMNNPVAVSSPAIKALRQYYDAVNSRDFNGAYRLLSANFKRKRTVTQFRGVFSSTLSIYPVRINTLSRSGYSETVDVELVVVDDDYKRTKWVGPIVMVQEGGIWKMETSRNLMKAGTAPLSADTPSIGVSGQTGVEQAISDYYRAVNLREFDTAYRMLSAGFRNRRPVHKYRSIFNTTLSTYLREARLMSGDASYAQVYVEVDVIDNHGDRSRWAGPVSLVREANVWKIETMKGLRKAG